MCLPVDDRSMMHWLRRQVLVIEAWREEVASRPDLDLETVTRIEDHYQWLTAELTRLEEMPRLRAVGA